MHQVSFSLASTPCNETCAQTRVTANWAYLQHLECEVYRAALIARFSVPPTGARLNIRDHAHDFGSYTQVEICFDRDDDNHVAWFERVENGLSTWLEANFTAPVIYNDKSQERPGSRRDAGDVITAALVTSLQLVAGGYATDREHDAIANLSAAYPACAEAASAKLREINATRTVLPKTMAALDRLSAEVDRISANLATKRRLRASDE